MISQKCRGITFLSLYIFRYLPPWRACVLLRRDYSAFFLEVKKQTFSNWSKRRTLGGVGSESCEGEKMKAKIDIRKFVVDNWDKISPWWMAQIYKLIWLAIQREDWFDVVKDNVHQVSTVGRFKNKITDTILLPSARVHIVGGGARGLGAVLLKASGQPKPDKRKVCRHLDGDAWLGNHIGNVKWGTQSENVRDAIKHGTFAGDSLFFGENGLRVYEWALENKDLPEKKFIKAGHKEFHKKSKMFIGNYTKSRIVGIAKKIAMNLA